MQHSETTQLLELCLWICLSLENLFSANGLFWYKFTVCVCDKGVVLLFEMTFVFLVLGLKGKATRANATVTETFLYTYL